jgi:hypothetical protein
MPRWKQDQDMTDRRLDRATAAKNELQVLKENPFKMEPEEIAMWLGGGALPGSVKFEQARAAMDWHTAQMQAKAQTATQSQHWARKVGALAALIGSIAALLTALHTIQLI